jgi:hypothetical protein
MGAGILTPIAGVILTKIVTFDFDTYPRVIQGVFSAGLLLFVAGILIKNYWPASKEAAHGDPAQLWANDAPTTSEQPFDWTGIGCASLALGPGLFFVIGFLFASEFEYAPVAGFICLVFFLLVGLRLNHVSSNRKQAALEAKNAAAYTQERTRELSGEATVETQGEITDRRPPQIVPGRRPEGFVLVDTSKSVTCGIAFMGFFTAVWYAVTIGMMFLIASSGKPTRGSREGGLLGMGVFLLAGLLPLYLLIRLIRMGRAFEKQAELLLPHWPPEAGETIEMAFQAKVRRDLTAMNIDVALECQKVDRSGSETKTTKVDTRTLSLRDFKQQDKLINGKWQMAMPSDWALPYASQSQDINWQVQVVVELAEGPKGVFHFPLLVVPKHPTNHEVADIEMTP